MENRNLYIFRKAKGLSKLSILMFIISSSTLLGCNESNFSGNEGPKSAPASQEPNELDEIPTSPEENKDCVEGDKLNFEWTGEIKKCLIDEGRTFNFDTNTCMNMRKASFDCDWDNIKSAMKKLGLSSSVIEKDSSEGAKLVSCGQSKDENRIVAQWVKLPKEGFDCKAKKVPANITTGCYTMYVNETPPPDPETAEEKQQQVAECMDSL